ncbi:MAG: hypothetical protein P4K78_14055 [Terracidiphilus sp.]|nr:hypothetical protein [Terracidiphilus sp.]
MAWVRSLGDHSFAPHVGHTAQVHRRLRFAHPACVLLEYIPWLRDRMKQLCRIESGHYVAPGARGAGMTPNQRAFKEINKA